MYFINFNFQIINISLYLFNSVGVFFSHAVNKTLSIILNYEINSLNIYKIKFKR